MNELTIAGIILSLAFAELTGISPGGIVVPAYFVLFWGDPIRMALTLLVGSLCMLIVRFLSRHMILYGQRRFAMHLMVGLVLKLLFGALYAASPLSIPNLSLSIGYIVPGLLAHDAERQGTMPTLLGLGIVTALLKLIMMVPGWAS